MVTTERRFYTQKAYEDKSGITPSMEDYLEMIYRQKDKKGQIRLSALAKSLNVGVPAASKMAGKLKGHGYIEYEPYGIITITKKGEDEGERLILRHNILSEFFSYVNQSDDELELVETIEHFFDMRTIENLRSLLIRLKADKG